MQFGDVFLTLHTVYKPFVVLALGKTTRSGLFWGCWSVWLSSLDFLYIYLNLVYADAPIPYDSCKCRIMRCHVRLHQLVKVELKVKLSMSLLS